MAKIYLAEKAELEAVATYTTPELYGAVGNGQHDDTDAIASCMMSGKMVLLGSKTYRVTRSIEIPRYTTLRVVGAGELSVIKFEGDGYLFDCDYRASDVTGSFENFTVVGNGATATSKGTNGFISGSLLYVDFIGLHIMNMGTAINSERTNTQQNPNNWTGVNKFSHCRFDYCDVIYAVDSGIRCNDIAFSQCKIYNSTALWSKEGGTFENLSYSQCNIEYVEKFVKQSTHTAAIKCFAVTFDTCYLEYFQLVNEVKLTGNITVDNCWVVCKTDATLIDDTRTDSTVTIDIRNTPIGSMKASAASAPHAITVPAASALTLNVSVPKYCLMVDGLPATSYTDVLSLGNSLWEVNLGGEDVYSGSAKTMRDMRALAVKRSVMAKPAGATNIDPQGSHVLELPAVGTGHAWLVFIREATGICECGILTAVYATRWMYTKISSGFTNITVGLDSTNSKLQITNNRSTTAFVYYPSMIRVG